MPISLSTPPASFRPSTALTALLGSGALILTGEANLLLCLPILFVPLGYYRSWRGLTTLSRRTIGLLVFLDLSIFLVDLIWISQDTLLAVVHLTIFFQALKSFDLNGHEDHTQVHFMGLLQVILVSELTLSVWFAALLLLFMITLVISLMDGYLNEGEAPDRRTRFGVAALRVTAWTLVILLGLFFTIPRTAWMGFWGKSHVKRLQTTGFSDAVDFGSYGEVKLDDTVVMRIELDGPPPATLYWRGNTLSTFDGMSWTRTSEGARSAFSKDRKFTLGRSDADRLIRQTIYLEPINTRILFALPTAVEMEAEFRYLSVDHDNVYRLRREPRGRIRYTVWSDPEQAEDRTPPEKTDLELPGHLDRIERMAQDLTVSIPDPKAKALKILSHLRNLYGYSLDTAPSPSGAPPIEDFLFNTKKGYCEHFSTAMALMLRSVGIPARIVTGFLGGDVNPVGNYVLVRQSDAHAWVEAWIEDRWLRLDPTPPAPLVGQSRAAIYLDVVRMAWFKYIVSYSSLEQRRAVYSVGEGLASLSSLTLPDLSKWLRSTVRPLVPILVALLVPLAGFWALRRLHEHRRMTNRDRALMTYLAILKILERQGHKKSPSQTPLDFGRRLAESGETADALLAAQALYRIRYADAEDDGELHRCLVRLRQSRRETSKRSPLPDQTPSN